MIGRRAPAAGRGRVRAGIAFAALLVVFAPASARAECSPRGANGAFGGLAEPSNRLVVADLDGDGLPDLVTSPVDGDLTVRRGLVRPDGTMTFSTPTYVPLGSIPVALVAGDWDGDGIMDLAAGTVDRQVVIVAGHGRGATWSMSVVQRCPAPDIPLYIAAGDLDGDGHPDLVTTDPSSLAVHLYESRADGTFAGPQDYALEGLPAQLRIADADGDGLPDVLVAALVPSAIEFLPGNGGSGVGHAILGRVQTFLQNALPGLRNLQVGDLDEDGDLDAVVSFASTTAATGFQIWRGRMDNGKYSITPSVRIFTYSRVAVTGVEIGDFDGDHHLDVALLHDTGGQAPGAEIYYGDGVRNLAGPYAIAGPLHGTDMVATDVDGDGAKDLALVGQQDNWYVDRGTCPPPPAIYRVEPTSGAIGDTVNVFGRGLDQVWAATLGGAAAGIVTRSPRQLTLRVPDGAVSGPIVLETDSASIVTETFLVGKGPVVRAFAPRRAKAGETIAVRGAHLLEATGVTIGAYAAARFYVLADTLLDAMPDTVDAGGVVVVTTPFGRDTSAEVFELAPPDTAPQHVTVTDVPADEGGRVLVTWTASDFDRAGRGRIQSYRVLRRAPQTPPAAAAHAARHAAAAGEVSRALDDWEEVATLPIARRDAYSIEARTHADSTAAHATPATFVVDAIGADGSVYPSPPGSGSSVDNLAPAAVRSLTARRHGPQIELNWAASPEPDVAGYTVYAGEFSGFPTTPEHRVAFVTEPQATIDAAAMDSCFRVVAEDVHGNRALAAEVVLGNWLPTRFELHLLGPLPVHDVLTMELALPAAGSVRLEALDIAGRRVLDETAAFDHPGIVRHAWTGFAALRQGVYFVRVRQGGETRTARAVVAR